MATKEQKKIVIVREHLMHLPVILKNPTGITIRDRHPRRLKGTSLKINNLFFLSLVVLVGCSSSSYKIDRQEEWKTQILVTQDRVILECYRLMDYSGDIKEAHLFSMYVLDEEKTVLTVSQGTILDKEDCFRRINKISKILKDGNKIFMGGMGNLDKPREIQQRSYSFPGLGQFPENGRNLQFMTVWNDKGMCYNAYSGDQKPCPSDEFPIGKSSNGDDSE